MDNDELLDFSRRVVGSNSDWADAWQKAFVELFERAKGDVLKIDYALLRSIAPFRYINIQKDKLDRGSQVDLRELSASEVEPKEDNKPSISILNEVVIQDLDPLELPNEFLSWLRESYYRNPNSSPVETVILEYSINPEFSVWLEITRRLKGMQAPNER